MSLSSGPSGSPERLSGNNVYDLMVALIRPEEMQRIEEGLRAYYGTQYTNLAAFLEEIGRSVMEGLDEEAIERLDDKAVVRRYLHSVYWHAHIEPPEEDAFKQSPSQ